MWFLTVIIRLTSVYPTRGDSGTFFFFIITFVLPLTGDLKFMLITQKKVMSR